MCGQVRRAIGYFAPIIDKAGLSVANKMLVDTGKKELCEALKAITNAAARGDTVLFHCTLGKDRTGMVAALILSVVHRVFAARCVCLCSLSVVCSVECLVIRFYTITPSVNR